MSDKISTSDLFKTDDLWNSKYFSNSDPFQYLGKNLKSWIEHILDELGVSSEPLIEGDVSAHAFVSGRVYIAPGAIVEPTAMIQGPCVIGPDTEVRHGAYIRGQVYVGQKCVVGHTTEVKGSLFMDGAKAGHFAYVGDSILGRNVNLGAGTKLANLKFDGREINYRSPKDRSQIATGLKKCGALLGDGSQTGCNSVLDPGAILFPSTAVLPCVHFRGTLTHGFATKRP